MEPQSLVRTENGNGRGQMIEGAGMGADVALEVLFAILQRGNIDREPGAALRRCNLGDLKGGPDAADDGALAAFCRVFTGAIVAFRAHGHRPTHPLIARPKVFRLHPHRAMTGIAQGEVLWFHPRPIMIGIVRPEVFRLHPHRAMTGIEQGEVLWLHPRPIMVGIEQRDVFPHHPIESLALNGADIGVIGPGHAAVIAAQPDGERRGVKGSLQLPGVTAERAMVTGERIQGEALADKRAQPQRHQTAGGSSIGFERLARQGCYGDIEHLSGFAQCFERTVEPRPGVRRDPGGEIGLFFAGFGNGAHPAHLCDNVFRCRIAPAPDE